MALSFGILSKMPRRKSKQGVISFAGFPHGLNTILPPSQLAKTELSESVNFKNMKGGSVATRAAVVKYSNSPVPGGNPITMSSGCVIGNTNYELIADSLYKIYYYDPALDPVLIGTAIGEVTCISFKGAAIILDGSYVKYIDDVASLKIAYDDGSGASAFQTNNRAGDNDSFLALGNATNVRVAVKFTSQAWDAGFTIPPTTFYATLQREGAGFTGVDNAPIIAKLRLVSDDSILASKTFKATAGSVAAVATEYHVTFEAADITTEMSPSVPYYMTLEYNNGGAADYIKVVCSDVAAGLSFYYIAAWVADNSKTPLMGLKPGRPPKGAFGKVCDNRIYIAGDPDNKGYVWFGNLTYLDWSSADGGGYVGAIDNDSNNFEIGGLETLFNGLYVYGTETQPYIAKLTGASPSTFVLPGLLQRGWTIPKGLVSTINDIWSVSREGIDSLRGVQEYGDVRAFSESDPIYDRLEAHYTNASITGYCPQDSQFWLFMPGYHRILVCGTKMPIPDPTQTRTRYPWTEYEITREILAPAEYLWLRSGYGGNEFAMHSWAEQDYTTFTETDPAADITVAAASITVNTLKKETPAWVYRNYGANYFNGDINHKFSYKVTDADMGAALGIWGLAEHVMGIADIAAAGNSCLSIVARRSSATGTYALQLWEYDGGTLYNDNTNLVEVNTEYYITVVRDEDVGDHGKAYCYIYTDSDRTVLLDTLSLTLHSSMKDYRYLYAVQSMNEAGVQETSCIISNLTIPGNPSLAIEPGFILADGKAAVKGTAGALNDHEWEYADNGGLGYDTLYFCDADGDPEVSGLEIRDILAPASFDTRLGTVFIGGADGHSYKLDPDSYKDMDDHHIRFSMRSAYAQMPFTHVNLIQQQVDTAGTTGAQYTLDIYKDDSFIASAASFLYALQIDDRLTIADLTMDIEDAYFLIGASEIASWKPMNMNVRTFQMGVSGVLLAGNPLFINGFHFRYRTLEA